MTVERQRVKLYRAWHWVRVKPSGPQHGTRTAYVFHECRCDRCTEANRDYQRQWQRTHPRYDRMTLPVDKIPPHGSLARYQKRGCRCKLCKRASADARWHHRQVMRQRSAIACLKEDTAA